MTVPWRYIIPPGLTAAAAALGWLWWPSLVFLLPLVVLAWVDFFQSEHTLRRNYPLVARTRWVMEDLRPFAQAYIVEDDLEGRPFSHQERALVYARAKEISTRTPSEPSSMYIRKSMNG